VLSGWLIEPDTVDPTPTVIVLGGIDAWREEFEVGAGYLTERGPTAFLVDAPGQGETRLFGGLYFDAHAVPAIGAFIDAALARPGSSGAVGLWGNSAGGWLAAHVAARDPRVDACCVNGGTDRPTEILDRYPRYVERLQIHRSYRSRRCTGGD
jgi:pimeloyl-ACP methyl ester carboxylesterase